MNPKRILVLGTTGVDKRTAIDKLIAHHKIAAAGQESPTVVHFEHEFVNKEEVEVHNFLDDREHSQRATWRRAWGQFRRRLKTDLRDRDVILALHGVLARSLYGVRSPVNLDDLREFRPTRIVTLIDDAYIMWWRTETRAGGQDYKGRPTLEQLVAARRAELFFGDIVAKVCETDQQLRNYMLAVRHPARTLHRLLFPPEEAIFVYLSFPISGPRRWLAKSKPKGIEEVNLFLKQAADFERANPQVACFCPLAIDELPLSTIAERPKKGTATFPLYRRWNVRDFWQDDELLCNDATLPDKISLDSRQVANAFGMITTDVALRDYRLVMQSRRLAIFNPWFDGKKSGGVDNEIACAMDSRIPMHIFQDKRHDQTGQARAELRPRESSLGQRPGHQYVTFHNSLTALFKSLRP